MKNYAPLGTNKQKRQSVISVQSLCGAQVPPVCFNYVSRT